MTTKEDIRKMLLRKKEEGCTHCLIVCDTFVYDDYPVGVSSEENVNEVYKKYNQKNMQKVMEVYNLSMDLESQLNQDRAFNF